MRYDSYRYLYPPRPDMAVAAATLPLLEIEGAWAQAKMNGTCCVIFVPPDGKAFALGRHGPDNRLQWQPGTRWEAFQARFPGEGWYVLVGELLHSKGVGVRDTVYLFDLLVDDGEYLVGQTYRERYLRLRKLCGKPELVSETHGLIREGIWLAFNRTRGFAKWFAEIGAAPGSPMIEGLVFKSPDSKLKLCGRPKANSVGQHKCRRPTANLSF